MISPPPAIGADDSDARRRITLAYWWRHGRLPDLDDPMLFTELVQRRKLSDRDPRMPHMADKVAAKSIVADRLGAEWVIPMLWSGEKLPPRSPWDLPVVVKSRHGCNQNAFILDPRTDWAAARHASAKWMRRHYGRWLDEWLYSQIPRGLLIEPLVGSVGALPIDYKIYVFGGRATHVQVHLDRARKHRWIVYDTRWRAITNDALSVPRPSGLDAMIAAAEELADSFDFARVDFYQPDDQPLFGEISFYPGSGLDRFDPPALDAEMGRLWRAAIASPACDRHVAVGSDRAIA